MELTPRKQAVLKAVIKAYIDTGEPIGSKILTGLLENAPSSATLRNEMSELCDLGLLQQPHTSAGRVPTIGGLKLYIDSLMPETQVPESAKQLVDEAFDSVHCEPEQIPAVAAKLLSRLTGLPAISCTVSDRVPTIKRIELLPVSRYSVMLLVITDDGRTRSRVFRQSSDFTPNIKRLFEEISKKYLLMKPIDSLNPGYIQNIAISAGMSALELVPLLTTVCDIVADITARDVSLQNEGALYNVCGDDMSAAKIMSLINSGDPMISILEGIEDGAGAVFGAHTGYEELSQNTIVAAKFKVADKYKGYIGIIGPNRMSYEQIMPCTLYIAERLGEIMTEAQKDMED